MQCLFGIHITIGLRRFRELLLAGPVGAGAIRVMLQKCWKSSNGQNPRNGSSRPLWPSIKYTTIWSTLSRIGTCRRLVEGTGVPGPTLFSITVRMHTRMDWNFPPPRPQDNCNLEWTYNRSCLCGDSWWVEVEDIVTRVWVGTWLGGLSLRTACK